MQAWYCIKQGVTYSRLCMQTLDAQTMICSASGQVLEHEACVACKWLPCATHQSHCMLRFDAHAGPENHVPPCPRSRPGRAAIASQNPCCCEAQDFPAHTIILCSGRSLEREQPHMVQENIAQTPQGHPKRGLTHHPSPESISIAVHLAPLMILQRCCLPRWHQHPQLAATRL